MGPSVDEAKFVGHADIVRPTTTRSYHFYSDRNDTDGASNPGKSSFLTQGRLRNHFLDSAGASLDSKALRRAAARPGSV